MSKRIVSVACWIFGIGGLLVGTYFISQAVTDVATPLDDSTHALRTAGETLREDGLDPKLVVSGSQADVLSGDSGKYFDRADCTTKPQPGDYYRIRSCAYFNGETAEAAIRRDDQTLQVNTFIEPIKGETRAYDDRLSTAKLSSLSYEKENSTFGQTYTPLNVSEIPELKGVTMAFAEMGRGLKNPSGVTLNYGQVTVQVWMQNADLERLLMAAETVTSNLK